MLEKACQTLEENTAFHISYAPSADMDECNNLPGDGVIQMTVDMEIIDDPLNSSIDNIKIINEPLNFITETMEIFDETNLNCDLEITDGPTNISSSPESIRTGLHKQKQML